MGEASLEDKQKNRTKIPFSFEDDPGSNNSGFYELQVRTLVMRMNIFPVSFYVLTYLIFARLTQMQ